MVVLSACMLDLRACVWLFTWELGSVCIHLIVCLGVCLYVSVQESGHGLQTVAASALGQGFPETPQVAVEWMPVPQELSLSPVTTHCLQPHYQQALS